MIHQCVICSILVLNEWWAWNGILVADIFTAKRPFAQEKKTLLIQLYMLCGVSSFLREMLNVYSASYYDVVQTHGFTAQRGFMWILSFHWIVRHQISCQNQLNLKTDFISPPNAMWLLLWIYSGLLWNVVRAKCGGGSSFDNITCTFLSRKLNFIFWICSMIGYFWDFEIWSRV